MGALPSLRLLYLVDDIRSPRTIAKSVAHQWYWSYETIFGNQNFDSYMLKRDVYRNLDVDNRLILQKDSRSKRGGESEIPSKAGSQTCSEIWASSPRKKTATQRCSHCSSSL